MYQREPHLEDQKVKIIAEQNSIKELNDSNSVLEFEHSNESPKASMNQINNTEKVAGAKEKRNESAFQMQEESKITF